MATANEFLKKVRKMGSVSRPAKLASVGCCTSQGLPSWAAISWLVLSEVISM